MAAPLFRVATKTKATKAKSFSVAVPTGTQIGDLALLYCTLRNETLPELVIPETGGVPWTLLSKSVAYFTTTHHRRTYLLMLKIGSPLPTSVLIKGEAEPELTEISATFVVIQKETFNANSPVNVESTWNINETTTMSVPAVTTTLPECLVLSAVNTSGGIATGYPPTGYTEATTFANEQVGVVFREYAVAGTTESPTMTKAGSSPVALHTIALSSGSRLEGRTKTVFNTSSAASGLAQAAAGLATKFAVVGTLTEPRILLRGSTSMKFSTEGQTGSKLAVSGASFGSFHMVAEVDGEASIKTHTTTDFNTRAEGRPVGPGGLLAESHVKFASKTLPSAKMSLGVLSSTQFRNSVTLGVQDIAAAQTRTRFAVVGLLQSAGGISLFAETETLFAGRGLPEPAARALSGTAGMVFGERVAWVAMADLTVVNAAIKFEAEGEAHGVPPLVILEAGIVGPWLGGVSGG